jgi:hypothetical protein
VAVICYGRSGKPKSVQPYDKVCGRCPPRNWGTELINDTVSGSPVYLRLGDVWDFQRCFGVHSLEQYRPPDGECFADYNCDGIVGLTEREVGCLRRFDWDNDGRIGLGDWAYLERAWWYEETWKEKHELRDRRNCWRRYGEDVR